MKVQMPSAKNPIVDVFESEPRNDFDWISFFSTLQQIAYNATRSGTTADRPSNKTAGRWVGMPYFDTTLGKPVWLKSVNPDVWVDATGAAA